MMRSGMTDEGLAKFNGGDASDGTTLRGLF